ncbi:phosphoglycerate mutase-like protein [Martensiomyces pterosporus]|nr:phosphoglycerate mutase-like protein [Martensiomyces pterosporus]
MHLLPLSPIVLAAAYAASAAATPAKHTPTATPAKGASAAASATASTAATSPTAPTSGPSINGTTFDTDVSKYNFDDTGYNYCQAPFPSQDSYKAVPGAQLEFVQLVIWKGSCESGQLTDRGKAQHHYLGTQLRSIYVGKLGFLPSALTSTDSVYVRTTYVWRTKNTAESLLGGLWPNRGHDSTDAITLHTYPQSIETMSPNAAACPKVSVLSKEITTSDQFKQFLKEENGLMAKLNGNLGVSGSSWTKNWGNQVDVLLSRLCHGMKLPCTNNTNCPTDADVAQTMRNGHYQYAFNYRDHPLAQNYTRLAIGSFLATLRDQMQNHIAGKTNKLKIAIYSGHDSTVAPILGVLKASNRDMLWPPYASNIAFELWRKSDGGRVVRVIHNGQTLQLQSGAQWCDMESCPVAQFAKYLDDYIPQDIAAECASK